MISAGWSERQATWFLIAMHVPFIGFTTTMAATGLGLVSSSNGGIGLVLALSAGAIQLRHSLAAARGRRPRFWQVSFLAVLLIAFVPAPLFAVRWGTMAWLVIASSAMLLPGRAAVAIIAVTTIGWAGWLAAGDMANGSGILQGSWIVAYVSATLLMGGGSLYAAAGLARSIEQLRAARAELAELAVGRERLRISRDLHDLLGQTLSAVSLKGDLALGLLRRDEGAAAALEIDDLTSVARSALRDLTKVARREHAVSLAVEAEGAAELLIAAGIDTRMAVAVVQPAADLDELLGWALREGVTNVLRHSAATECSIRVDRDDRQGPVGDRERRSDRAGRGRLRPGRPQGACRRAVRVRHRPCDARRAVPPPGRSARGGVVIRVLIAEDMHLIRGALVALLSLETDIEVVAQLDRGDLILESALQTRPDVAVLDIDLPGSRRSERGGPAP